MLCGGGQYWQRLAHMVQQKQLVSGRRQTTDVIPVLFAPDFGNVDVDANSSAAIADINEQRQGVARATRPLAASPAMKDSVQGLVQRPRTCSTCRQQIAEKASSSAAASMARAKSNCRNAALLATWSSRASTSSSSTAAGTPTARAAAMSSPKASAWPPGRPTRPARPRQRPSSSGLLDSTLVIWGGEFEARR